MKLIIPALCLLLSVTGSTQSPDTIRVRDNKLKTSRLRTGTHDYVVFLEDSLGNRSRMSIWTRDLQYETIYGEEMIVVRQRWHSDDSMSKRNLVSYSRKKTFEPVFQKAGSKIGIDAFNFYGDKITGADTVPGSRNKKFSIVQQEPAFNWELDLEMLSTLPYAKGKSFVLPFYQPGSQRPAKFYTYAVTGTRIIETWNGSKEDCWVLEVIYNPDTKSRAEFFISRKSYDVLKMREVSGRIVRYKVKMGA
jgi:hypothetical protein